MKIMATIEKRNNAYKITVSCGYDMQGKQIRRRMTWAPPQGMSQKQIEKELQRQATLFEEKCRQGQYLGGNIRFADFAEYWFAEYAEKQLKPTTIENYRRKMPRINAAIGHIPLAKLQPSHIMQFIDGIEAEGSRIDARYIPANVSEEMEKQKLTRKKLAELSGMSYKTICDTLGGNGRTVTYNTAQAISSVLGKSVHECFTTKEKNNNVLSGQTVRSYYNLVSSVLQQAEYWKIIPYNLCHRVRPPKAEQKEARHLDEIEAAQLMDALQSAPDVYRTFVTVLLCMGYRRGEACGIEWSDIDFANGIISIERSTDYISKQGLFDDTPKTGGSVRVTKMPPAVSEALRRWKSIQAANRLKAGDKWMITGKVFTNEEGRQIYPNTFTRWFRGFVTENGLPNVCLHSLRHTNATLLIASGTNITTVAKRLGHSSTATTTRTYVHAIKTADELAAETLQDIFKIKRG